MKIYPFSKKSICNISNFLSFLRTLLTKFLLLFYFSFETNYFKFSTKIALIASNLSDLPANLFFHEILYPFKFRGTFPVSECNIQIFECKHTNIALFSIKVGFSPSKKKIESYLKMMKNAVKDLRLLIQRYVQFLFFGKVRWNKKHFFIIFKELSVAKYCLRVRL